ncbi:MAG: flagellar biosynthetic protein FliO [Candidatus Schekmanbacteria bacterium]|nr:flagellar biosynthetic protein FliO [Candidatus Schekmanbacteria bacterium]
MSHVTCSADVLAPQRRAGWLIGAAVVLVASLSLAGAEPETTAVASAPAGAAVLEEPVPDVSSPRSDVVAASDEREAPANTGPAIGEDDAPPMEGLLGVGLLLKTLLALTFVGGGAYVVLRLGLPRAYRSAVPRGRLLAVMDTVGVAPNRTVHIVRAGKRYFLLGSGEKGLDTLAEIPASDVDELLAEETAGPATNARQAPRDQNGVRALFRALAGGKQS